jgi:tyrosyl-tRNA synthetase
MGLTFDSAQLAAMSALRSSPSRSRQFVCRQCIRQQHTLARGERPAARWADEELDAAARQAQWKEQAGRVRSGMQQSMLSLLEERGFVKDVAG